MGWKFSQDLRLAVLLPTARWYTIPDDDMSTTSMHDAIGLGQRGVPPSMHDAIGVCQRGVPPMRAVEHRGQRGYPLPHLPTPGGAMGMLIGSG